MGEVKKNVVMASMISDNEPLDKMESTCLYSLLTCYSELGTKFLKSLPSNNFLSYGHHHTVVVDKTSEYEFFHDYDKPLCKYLDLHQKWPRPGSKSLDKFLRGNKDLVYLEVADCRENIEAVHFLTSHCPRLEVLRLFATDPLLTYSEVLKLSHLKYLELQFDSFYREHRDQFLYSLGSLSQLQVLKFHTCYGMNDDHAESILYNCRSLHSLRLPLNTRINGWFLESLIEHLKNPSGTFSSKLRSLDLHINSAYTQLQITIPELHVFDLIKTAKDFDLALSVQFCHKKLPSFNPKGFHF